MHFLDTWRTACMHPHATADARFQNGARAQAPPAGSRGVMGGRAFGVTNPIINSFAVVLPKIESSEPRMLYAMMITAIESQVALNRR